MAQLNIKKSLAFCLICCMCLLEFFSATTQISIDGFVGGGSMGRDCYPAFISHADTDTADEDSCKVGVFGGFVQTLTKRAQLTRESNDEERMSEEFYPILVFTGILCMFQILFKDRRTASVKGQQLALILHYIHSMDGKKDGAAAVGV